MAFEKAKDKPDALCKLPEFQMINEGGIFTKKLPYSKLPYTLEIPEELESIIEYDKDTQVLKTQAETKESGKWTMKVKMDCEDG
jgi:hypothetical protein